ncbi:MAG: hypothetical protein LBU27_00070 [Candidatus Peribacteria bacterium]|jgi:predicted RNase H-like HicB family nuclease|nr:hypothetical protein [Candidatus Peribacteria bacterium]
MKNIIRIEIKEYNDFTHPYFLGESPDLPELLVEGRTVEEVLALAPDVVAMILEANQEIAEREAKQTNKRNFFEFGKKDIIMQYIYNKPISLQLT